MDMELKLYLANYDCRFYLDGCKKYDIKKRAEKCLGRKISKEDFDLAYDSYRFRFHGCKPKSESGPDVPTVQWWDRLTGHVIRLGDELQGLTLQDAHKVVRIFITCKQWHLKEVNRKHRVWQGGQEPNRAQMKQYASN